MRTDQKNNFAVSCNTSEPTGTPSDPGAYITLLGICQITQTGKFLCRTFCGCPNVKPHGGAVNRDNSVVLTRYSHLKFVSLRSGFSVGTGQRSPLLMQFCLSTKSLTRCRPELGDQADDSPAVHTRWRCTVLTFRVRSGFRACVPAYERRQHSRADNPSAAWVAIEYSSALVLFAAARVRGCEPDYDDTTTSASPVIRLSTLGTPGNRHPARTASSRFEPRAHGVSRRHFVIVSFNDDPARVDFRLAFQSGLDRAARQSPCAISDRNQVRRSV